MNSCANSGQAIPDSSTNPCAAFRGVLPIGASFRRAETESGPRWVAQDVHAGGPGHAAGLRPLDVLIAINGKQINPPDAPMFPMGVRCCSSSTARVGRANAIDFNSGTAFTKAAICGT